jgi:rubrerythrin
LAIITEQIESQKDDKLGLDIGFADEHGDESAEAETDISQLTKDTLDSVKQHDGDRDVVFCHECSAEWYRDENGLTCPKCQNELVEIVCFLLSLSFS